MARNTSLESVIESIFLGDSSNSMITRYNYRNRKTVATTPKVYMEIPINSDVFELPMLAYEAFLHTLKRDMEYDTLTAQLYACEQHSSYKSLDTIMRDVLSTKFSKHLNEVLIAGSPNKYYATFGAVFDVNLKPLMMLSWIMEKKQIGDGKFKYHYKRPLLRLSPHPCMNKADTLQRWLSGKLLTTSLSTSISPPYHYGLSNCLNQTTGYLTRDTYLIKVEIDECPFIIRSTETPSISVTNEELLQLAASHIDEIMQ